MSPSSFTFTLAVPNDPELVVVVADLARHAAEYATLANGEADGFIERTRSAAAAALKGSVDRSTLVVFAAADGTLTAVVGGETITAPLATA
jgi:hypothetical protein